MVKSCLGTTTSAGIAVTALVEAINEEHISGAAIRANRRLGPPYWGNPNALLRSEPTWGDVDALVRIIGELRPSNAPQLLAAFSSCYSHARALQLIRNCASHNHKQNISEIQKLRSAYVVFPISHLYALRGLSLVYLPLPSTSPTACRCSRCSAARLDRDRAANRPIDRADLGAARGPIMFG